MDVNEPGPIVAEVLVRDVGSLYKTPAQSDNNAKNTEDCGDLGKPFEHRSNIQEADSESLRLVNRVPFIWLDKPRRSFISPRYRLFIQVDRTRKHTSINQEVEHDSVSQPGLPHRLYNTCRRACRLRRP